MPYITTAPNMATGPLSNKPIIGSMPRVIMTPTANILITTGSSIDPKLSAIMANPTAIDRMNGEAMTRSRLVLVTLPEKRRS